MEGRDGFIEIKNVKEQFIPAEYSLLTEWSYILEGEQKGSTLVYLQLQVGINRDPDRQHYGKSWLAVKTIAERCAMSRPTVHACLDTLCEHKFILKENRISKGKPNLYTILDLPKCVAEVVSKELVSDFGESVFNEKFEDIMLKYKNQAEEKIKGLQQKITWSCNDLLKYFTHRYLIVLGVRSREKFTNKERRLFKLLLEDYGMESSKLIVDYALSNWEEKDYLSGYPTVAGVYGFRDTFYSEVKKGNLKTASRGQYSSKGSKEVVAW